MKMKKLLWLLLPALLSCSDKLPEGDAMYLNGKYIGCCDALFMGPPTVGEFTVPALFFLPEVK